MFTVKEFFLFWLPTMGVGLFIFSSMVMSGTISLVTASILWVVLGIVLKYAARKFNEPVADSTNEVTPE